MNLIIRIMKKKVVGHSGGFRGVRGVQMHPPLVAINVFCVHNCTSPSNDYAAVACSSNHAGTVKHSRISSEGSDVGAISAFGMACPRILEHSTEWSDVGMCLIVATLYVR